MNFRHAVIEIFNQDCLNIFEYSGRPEVASDVIFGGSIEDIEVDLLCKFRDPSSTRFRVIPLDHFVTDTHTDIHTDTHTHARQRCHRLHASSRYFKLS